MTPYYEKDGVTIYCGDNSDVLMSVPKSSIDLVVTSPPYDDLREYGGHSWDFYGVAWHLRRVLKEGGVIVWIVNDGTHEGSETGTSWSQALHFKALGMRIHDTMIWQKTSFSFPESTRYQPVFEYMFILSKGPPRTTNLIKDRQNKWAGQKVHGTGREKDGTTRHHNAVRRQLNRVYQDEGQRWNVWVVPNPGVPGQVHPATFPERLARDHILTWSNKGDTVLDPFNGSGTTAAMAREMGRNAIGIDINEEYCGIAMERLRQGVFAFTD